MQVDLATRHIARLSRFALDGSHHCANHDRAEPLILLPRIVPAQTTLLQFEKTARELAPLAPLLELATLVTFKGKSAPEERPSETNSATDCTPEPDNTRD